MMTASVLDVSVVICAYTEARWDDLVAAVQSLTAQSYRPLEVIVVIDHNPALLQRARTAWPEGIVIENGQPRGLSGARNSGVAIARGEIVAFIDDDALAAPDWLAQLLHHYRDPQVVGVGGAIQPLWMGDRPGWFPQEFDWVVGCTYRGLPEQTAVVRNLIGCNMSFRREVFAALGGFRTGIGRVGQLPVGCEETEFCIRISQRWPQRTFIYEPRAQVHHTIPKSRMAWRYFQSRCFGEGWSKAFVAHLRGSHDGLSTERAYTLNTLPRGVMRGMTDAVMRGDLAGISRAGAIGAGLAFTVAGYLAGQVARRQAQPDDVWSTESVTPIANPAPLSELP